MAKKNSRQNTAQTIEQANEPQAAPIVEAPANDSPASPDLTGLEDAELHRLLSACLAEVKHRKAEALATLPPVGSTVRIIAGKWDGMSGELVSRGKTRCHVRVEGFPLPAYVLLNDVVPAT